MIGRLPAVCKHRVIKAQVAFEDDEAFGLIGSHKRVALEQLLSTAREKVEYRPGNMDTNCKLLEKLLALSESSQSPVVFVEREDRPKNRPIKRKASVVVSKKANWTQVK